MWNFLRQFWVEILATGAVAVIDTVLVYLRNLHPIITFLLILGVTSSAVWLVIRRTKRRAEKHQREAIRKERKKQREIFADSTAIPNILFQMFERSKRLVEAEAKNMHLDVETLQKMADDLFNAGYIDGNIPSLEQMTNIKELEKMLKKMPRLKEFDTTEQRFRKLLLGIQGMMGSKEMGVLKLVKEDRQYQSLLEKLRKLQVGLPKAINTRIDSYTHLTNAMNNLSLFDFHSIDLPPEAKNQLQYFQPATYGYAQECLSDISNLIERFLLGEDIR